MTHLAYVEADLASFSRGGTSRTAVCLCGWKGPERGTLEVAADDALEHERAANEAPAQTMFSQQWGGPPHEAHEPKFIPVTLTPRFHSIIEREEYERVQAANRANSERALQLHQEREEVKGQRDEARADAAKLQKELEWAVAVQKAALESQERLANEVLEASAKLRFAEAVRDDARAASQRYLDEKRLVEDRFMELGKRFLEVPDGTTFNGKLVVSGTRTPEFIAGWRRGVLEANDKLYAAATSGVVGARPEVLSLSMARVVELLNILLQNPPEAS